MAANMGHGAILPLEADEIGARPTEPTLADFGLSPSDVLRIPQTFFDVGGTTFVGSDRPTNHDLKVVAVVVAVPAFIALLLLIGPWRMLGFALALPIIFAVLFGVLHGIELMLFKTFSPRYRSYREFLSVKKAYDVKLAAYEEWIARKHEKYWRSLSGIMFERKLGELFSRMGYEVEHTPHTGDGGVDLRLMKDGTLTVVQCKARNKRVPISVARELRASMADFGADKGVIACLEGVTEPVTDYIKDKNIAVLDVRDIVALQTKLA